MQELNYLITLIHISDDEVEDLVDDSIESIKKMVIDRQYPSRGRIITILYEHERY